MRTLLPPLDHPLWGHLVASDRDALRSALSQNAEAIAAAIARETRHHGLEARIQFHTHPDDLAATVAEIRRRSERGWRSLASLITLAGLVGIAGAAIGLDDHLIAAGVALAIAAATGLALWRSYRHAVGRLSPEDLQAILDRCSPVVAIDDEVIHHYTPGSAGGEPGVKRWANTSLRAMSYGWSGLPGLMLSTSQRKTRIPLTLSLDGTGEHPLAIEEADRILQQLFGDRYAGTTTSSSATSAGA